VNPGLSFPSRRSGFLTPSPFVATPPPGGATNSPCGLLFLLGFFSVEQLSRAIFFAFPSLLLFKAHPNKQMRIRSCSPSPPPTEQRPVFFSLPLCMPWASSELSHLFFLCHPRVGDLLEFSILVARQGQFAAGRSQFI